MGTKGVSESNWIMYIKCIIAKFYINAIIKTSFHILIYFPNFWTLGYLINATFRITLLNKEERGNFRKTVY